MQDFPADPHIPTPKGDKLEASKRSSGPMPEREREVHSGPQDQHHHEGGAIVRRASAPAHPRRGGRRRSSGGSYVRKTGTMPAQLQAVRLSRLAARRPRGGQGRRHQPLPLPARRHRQGRGQGERPAAKVAPHVTCKFCSARLVGAGVLDGRDDQRRDARGEQGYALDYGTRDAEKQLAQDREGDRRQPPPSAQALQGRAARAALSRAVPSDLDSFASCGV